MLLSFVFLMSGSLMAAEVDNFTLRDVPLRDSLETINNKTNVLFQEALDLANGKGCSEEELYSRVREKFRYGFNKGEFIQWMKKEDSLDRVFVDYRDGIYRDLWIFNLVVPLTVPFAGAFAESFNISGYRVGRDKFEHFLGTGRVYFMQYKRGWGIEGILKRGRNIETYLFGGYSTGVKSFGDMSANFNGMRFWNHILQTRPDPLGHNTGPYAKCVNERWVQVKRIDWKIILMRLLTKGLIAPIFFGKKNLAKVLKRIKDLGKGYTCPVDIAAHRKITKKYKGLGIVSEKHDSF